MKYDITHGLLSAQSSPKFLKINGNSVNLQLVEPMAILFSSGSMSILYEISKPVLSAWYLGVTNKSRKYLYIQLKKDGQLDFVTSAFPPGPVLASPPILPKRGQLYFDTTENLVKEWTGNLWEPKSLVYVGNILGSFLEQASIGDTYKFKKIRPVGRLLFDSNLDIISVEDSAFLTNQQISIVDSDTGSGDSTVFDFSYLSKNNFIASCGIPKHTLVGVLPNGMACIAGELNTAAVGISTRSYSKGETVIVYDGVTIPNNLGVLGRVFLGRGGAILGTPETSLFFQPVGFADGHAIKIKIEKYEKYV